MREPLRLRTPDRVRVVQVIETEATRGLGVEDDPVRVVTQYWSFDGRLLAEHDPSTPTVRATPEGRE